MSKRSSQKLKFAKAFINDNTCCTLKTKISNNKIKYARGPV